MTEKKNHQARVEQEIQRTLESLDSLEDIEASPYFQTRLTQALRENLVISDFWFYRITHGYRLLPAGLFFVIAINVLSLVVNFSKTNQSTDNNVVHLQDAAREYFSLSGNHWDDYIGSGQK